MAKANKPKTETPAENETAAAPATTAPKAKAEVKNGNKVFEEWHGRIEVVRHPRTGKVTGRNYIPQEKKREKVKITQREADNLNKGAANTEYFQKAVMYLEPGCESGKAIDVNDIVEDAFIVNE
jgi:hypothetical protein